MGAERPIWMAFIACECSFLDLYPHVRTTISADSADEAGVRVLKKIGGQSIPHPPTSHRNALIQSSNDHQRR